MAFKARVLIPTGVLTPSSRGCLRSPPPPPPPPRRPRRRRTTQPPAACPATPHSAAGPDSQNPISSSGRRQHRYHDRRHR